MDIAVAEQSGKPEGREKTPAEQSAELARRVEGRFVGTSGALTLQRAEQAPGVKDAEKDLNNKITELARAESALSEVTQKGEYQNLSTEDKVKFAEAMDKAKFYAQHAFAEPADAGKIQNGWKRAVYDFKQGTLGAVERAHAVLSGKMTQEGVSKLSQDQISGTEIQALQEYITQAPDLTPEDKTQLLATLESKIEELRAVESKLGVIAEQKRLPDGEEGQRSLQVYRTAAENYKQSQKSLREFLIRIENYRPQ